LHILYHLLALDSNHHEIWVFAMESETYLKGPYRASYHVSIHDRTKVAFSCRLGWTSGWLI
jgi:hypothetical protein